MMNSSSWEALLVEHVLVGRARGRILGDMRSGKAWNCDLRTGDLFIGNDRYTVEILGTFSQRDDSFLWAWANPGAVEWDASLPLVSSLRERAGRPGEGLFGQPEIRSSEVNPNELAYVAAELLGEHPVFVGVYNGGAMFLLVTSLRIELDDLPDAYVPGILSDVPAISGVNPRAAGRRFLERLGFAVSDTDGGLRASRGASTIVAAYDAAGRLERINATAAR
ncbi:MAG: hypothetical protein U0324_08275 [Polyangiales bacterium]